MTALTLKQIDELAAILAGERMGRSPTKEKAIARLVLLAGQSGMETRKDMPGIYAVLEQPFEDAKQEIEAAARHLDDDELQDPDAEAAAYADGKGYAEAPRRGPSPATLGAQAAKDDDAERLHEITARTLNITLADMDTAERIAPGHWRIGKDGAVIDVVKTRAKNEFSASVGSITETRKNYHSAIRACVAAHNSAAVSTD